MSFCSFCSLLCEYSDAEQWTCSLRQQSSAQLAQLSFHESPRIEGSPVSLDEAIAEAKRLLARSTGRVVTGRIRSVEGARGAVAWASQWGAFLDPSNSEEAFGTIEAIQRSGMVTASLSEIRFRSDCLLFLGDERLLDRFPRLLDLLDVAAEQPTSATKRAILVGAWGKHGLEIFRRRGIPTCQIDLEWERIPQALLQWSQRDAVRRGTSPNLVSRWISQANYVTLLWSPSTFAGPAIDLWTERLFQWIEQHNAEKRCVGLPLAGDYVTFQQVCTWITGFPGRVEIEGERFRYDRRRKGLESQRPVDGCVTLCIDESIRDDGEAIAATIWIAPRYLAKEVAPQVFIPCAVPGVEHPATFFRSDAVVAHETHDRVADVRRRKFLPVASILDQLAVLAPC